MLPHASAAASPPDTLIHAQPYQVVAEDRPHIIVGERTRAQWYITTLASTFEQFAHTGLRAAHDLHQRYGVDLAYVVIVPSRTLVGHAADYGWAGYAADGRGGFGMPGVNPNDPYTHRARVTYRRLTPRELEIAEMWKNCAPDFPSTSPLSSSLVDGDALRRHIATELGIDPENVTVPRLEMDWYVMR
jgi:hypothetical protein